MVFAYSAKRSKDNGASFRRAALGRMVFLLGACLLAAWPKSDPAAYLMAGGPPLAWPVMVIATLLAAGHYMLRLGGGDYGASANRPFWWVPLHRDPNGSEPRPESWAVQLIGLFMAIAVALPLLILSAAVNGVRIVDMGRALVFVAAWGLASGQIGRCGLLLWPGRPWLRWSATRAAWAAASLAVLLTDRDCPQNLWASLLVAGLAAGTLPADILLRRRSAADKPASGVL